MTVYICPENRDTRYNLWYVTYSCKLPYIQTRSIEDIREHGTRISTNKAYDEASAWERCKCDIPVVKIIEHWINGVNIFVVDMDKHARQIYNDLEAHLNAWGNHMDRSFNSLPVPEEDLIAMDEFATLMWTHAKWVDVKNIYSGLLQPIKAVPSIASLGQFWAELDKKKEQTRHEEMRNERMHVQNYSFGGIDYVKDTSRMMDEIRRATDISHTGRDAIDIHGRRDSFIDRMKEGGHFRNFKRSA